MEWLGKILTVHEVNLATGSIFCSSPGMRGMFPVNRSRLMSQTLPKKGDKLKVIDVNPESKAILKLEIVLQEPNS